MKRVIFILSLAAVFGAPVTCDIVPSLVSPHDNPADPSSPLAAPDPPEAATITSSDAQLSMSWNAVARATAYEVWYHTSDDSAQASQSGGDVAATTSEIAGLQNGTTYYVWLKAKNATGTSGFGPVASGTPVGALLAPDAPGQATVIAGDSQLSLSWTAVDRATVYQVWYHTAADSGLATRRAVVQNSTPGTPWSHPLPMNPRP